MKRLSIAFALFAMTAPLAVSQTSTWATDPMHSEVDFVVRHMSVSNIHGRFGGVKGTISYNEADPSKSTVNVTIDTTSVDTGVSMRDNDLKSANFFDVAQFPTATFTSTSISRQGMKLLVNGNLTLHGVTKPVQLEADGPSPTVPGMDHKPHSGYSAVATLARKDFGIGAKYPDSVVGDEIKLNIDLEVVKQ
jgi:polyisoprenoid-binding protein YceI